MTLQKKIIELLGVKPLIIPKKEIENRIQILKRYLIENTHLKTLIVGISGGQDSTLTGKLCQLSIQELRKEKKEKSYQFIALRLPYGVQIDEKDCRDAINFINPDQIFTINIKNAVLNSERSLKKQGIQISDYIKGNEKARERMKVQYSFAAITNGLVVGTGNAAENVTGFFTKYGDNGTDVNLISKLNKRQGKFLLKELNCPKHLYLKKPTADLEDEKPQKEDEVALGIKYNIIDDYLEGKKVNSLNKQIIERLYLTTEHKRKIINLG
ncbi:ammonia-dependent NAD(+) synthetase [Buchnera aphidicola]|jgi:NAD+ synthase|uniref:NH(3)-dependent NAD(+) synthetase n=1 Tax=Buchnera aphidicola subsp. Schizaphis graminum (strain Sg) TaxID=198804 RepID=NADE_BUCAP|nr:ammonia-dependent NAD(+) synthetase [Buchnera aphidicola]Q8K9W7.1 RecName: Full=NH(3)-dependent NAD(+) synthetase [Buchnera aphidicola str. Sg (Schizaphis graminum)]AAM67735.1 NH(3)-dependent NAD(+) synthetase [Buchnera aphidicola str. Sg (Schizaphis graminum)]AWI49767.1 NAD(+) synthetase [Buchnera aphidicola (Schizaphis graminum)]